ncbi:MAG: ethanolamine utilization protein EutN [Bacteroidetes bacterium CG23_combo_of_CG06-09_8_20_14_all_32_9]|nr:MAG: ethanolamine utilization protein EutN [Bacteroidetes bacterium CG23_combo_of_CG06-09_8_20_14_all_32_9]
MILGKVAGTVVSTSINVEVKGASLLLVDKCNQRGEKKGDYIVALDLVGANRDELVMISESTSARETPTTINKPVDAIIVGIIDIIDENEKVVYKKVTPSHK